MTRRLLSRCRLACCRAAVMCDKSRRWSSRHNTDTITSSSSSSSSYKTLSSSSLNAASRLTAVTLLRLICLFSAADMQPLISNRKLSSVNLVSYLFFTVRAVATDRIVFVGVFSLCYHDNSWTAARMLDEILPEHVSWQPRESYWFSRS